MIRFTKSVVHALKLFNGTSEIAITIINKPFTPILRMSFCTSSASSTEDNCNEQPNFAEITKDDPELEHKLKVLVMELEVFRQEGRLVPQNSTMKTSYWKELLNLRSISARRKYLLYLFKLEKTKENILKKKEEKRLNKQLTPKPSKENNVLNYDLGCNNMFLRFNDATMNQMYNTRLVQAMQFGEQLVIDCGYEDNMVTREIKNCAKQLMLLFAENRTSDDPYDLHFCNINREALLMRCVHQLIPPLYEPSFPLHLHEKSYTDIFPKEKLVYLTPHCREVLHTYDHDSIYIIGAIVDKVSSDPLSLAKAKKENIRMAKLPLDYYLEWGSGSGKSLTINQVLSIMIDIKHTGDWKYALRHVPRRKLVDYTQDVALKKFNRAIGYTAGSENESIGSQITAQTQWRPRPTTEEKIGYKSNNIKSSIRIKNILQENE